MNPYMKQYRRNQIENAPPEQILIMLYDGAIRFVAQARAAMESGDRVGKLEPISRALAIITELSNTLDHQMGGEVAENLDGLYHFMIRNLSRANLKNEVEALTPVETILKDLRATWAEAIDVAFRELDAAGESSAEPAGDAPEEEETRRLSAAF